MDSQYNTQKDAPLVIRSRRVWGAKEPEGQLIWRERNCIHPVVTDVFTAYSVKQFKAKETGLSVGARPNTFHVIREMKYTQKGDILSKRLDIRFNFMIGGDGEVYEGRGWHYGPCLPMIQKYMAVQAKSLYIGFIGDFTNEGPLPELFRLRDEIIKFGIKNDYISPKFSLWQLGVPSHFQLDFSHYHDI